MILALVSRRSLTIATTHLNQLKELATTSAGVVNASQVDVFAVANGAPTPTLAQLRQYTAVLDAGTV